jgi:hypothetical protein
MKTTKTIVAQLNARRSSGPRTARGKNRSCRNAVKHGLFSKELVLSDVEKTEFQALRRSLQSQLQPMTALQHIALEEIAVCTWRCKLAMRQETQHLRALLDIPKDGEPQPDEPIVSAARTKWFGSGRRELNEGIRVLEAFEKAVRAKGRVPAEWKEQLDRAFGLEFYELLVRWPTMGLDAILLANQMVRHVATFGRRGPGADDKASSQTGPDDKQSPQVILDPAQNLTMVFKLIDQSMGFLRDLGRSWETRGLAGSQAAGPTDFAPRYFTTASRDLHRAVEWYAHLKEQNL